MDIELIEHDDPALRTVIRGVLNAYTAARVGLPPGGQELAVLFRDADGVVEGGLCGAVRFGWFSLELAYVPAHRRGKGQGRAALTTLERAAQALGCHGVRTSTLSTQAPGFYERLGYTEFGQLELRPGIFDIYLFKRLPPLPGGAAAPVTETGSLEERGAIRAFLTAGNDIVLGPSDRRPLSAVVRDASGQVAGGLAGQTMRGWLNVELFVMPETVRRSGLGSQVLTMVHEAARARGVTGARLTTGSYQAPLFYEKHGYTAYGSLPDFLPGGHTRFLMAKRFDP
jgi:GNAT superfamily N-acetyltransferase